MMMYSPEVYIAAFPIYAERLFHRDIDFVMAKVEKPLYFPQHAMPLIAAVAAALQADRNFFSEIETDIISEYCKQNKLDSAHDFDFSRAATALISGRAICLDLGHGK